MDLSVLAAVGSFVVSERVLKPKATVLVILGAILAYDLTTKTHDVSSLRVYRGPALFAFTLMMCAYSLRTWRRNGIACDELLFLPGTAHGQRHGLDDANNVSMGHDSAPLRTVEAISHSPDEGDVAAGWTIPALELTRTNAATANSAGVVQRNSQSPVRSRTLSHESSISSIQEFVNSWDEDDTEHLDEDNRISTSTGAESEFFLSEEANSGSTTPSGNAPQTGIHQRGSRLTRGVERFRENHPQFTRLGSFFFFRSSATSTQSAEYAPSGPSVVGAALDLSMPILFNFHLYIEAYNHMDQYGSDFPAKILPLIFLSVLVVRSMFPPGRRMRFWSTMKFTATAPFHRSRFRDCFIGDVVTSLVRPCQDVLFALSYYVTVIWGTLSQTYGLSESGSYLERSWILHNVVLPSAALLPLWWKFLQTLRQSYDTGKRWPYLGNAFKYLSASVVILYGMTHREDRRSIWWLVCFAASMLYQIWWDTIMDWDLFVIETRSDQATDTDQVWFTSISSYRPNSYVLPFLESCTRPIRKMFVAIVTFIPSYKQIKLRPQRLYKSEAFYYKVFVYNTLFRFTWMLCYIPAYHLSASGEEQVTTFSSDTKTYVGVLLPLAEILRRALWGFLFLENETIKLQNGNASYSRIESVDEPDEENADQSEMSSMSDGSSKVRLPSWLGSPQLQDESSFRLRDRFRRFLECNERMRQRLFILELFLWAVAFVGLGLWATN
jgi:hypothetical protein